MGNNRRAVKGTLLIAAAGAALLIVGAGLAQQPSKAKGSPAAPKLTVLRAAAPGAAKDRPKAASPVAPKPVPHLGRPEITALFTALGQELGTPAEPDLSSEFTLSPAHPEVAGRGKLFLSTRTDQNYSFILTGGYGGTPPVEFWFSANTLVSLVFPSNQNTLYLVDCELTAGGFRPPPYHVTVYGGETPLYAGDLPLTDHHLTFGFRVGDQTDIGIIFSSETAPPEHQTFLHGCRIIPQR
jgi:hypothetical protein